jgi:hypothetical protein
MKKKPENLQKTAPQFRLLVLEGIYDIAESQGHDCNLTISPIKERIDEQDEINAECFGHIGRWFVL